MDQATAPSCVPLGTSELWLSEERFRVLVRATNAVVWTRSANGSFDTQQPAWEFFTGQKWEEYKGFGWIQAHSREERERVLSFWSNPSLCEVPGAIIERFTRIWSREHGCYRSVLTRAASLSTDPVSDRVMEWIGADVDISVLRETEERLALALETHQAGVIRWDLRTNLVSLDNRAATLLGTGDSLTPLTLDALLKQCVHPDDHQRVHEAWLDAVRKRADFAVEFRTQGGDGTTVSVAARGRVLQYGSDEPLQVDAACWDITERNRLIENRLQEEQRANKAERKRVAGAEEMQRLQRESVDTICHELRGPMTGLFGGVTLLRDAISELAKEPSAASAGQLAAMQEHISMMQECLQQQKVLVDDVLDLSRLDAGRMELNPEPVDLEPLLVSLRHVFYSQLHAKDLTLNVWVQLPRLIVLIDKIRLFQIVLNLVSNAIKFTPRGSIDIRASIQRSPSDDSSLNVRIEVEDSGIGMSSEELNRLFERFGQASRCTVSQFGGSGLGLVISRRLVKLMGGELLIESEKDRGTKITFNVAAMAWSPQDPVQPLLSAAVAPVFFGRPLTILVVEDNIINQKVLCAYLKRAGHLFQVACNGQEAVDKCATIDFDLIFMDIEMPMLDGCEATRKIRQQERERKLERHTPIVGLSGNVRTEHFEAALAAGMDDYTTKPYHEVQIRQMLAKHAQMRTPTKA